MIYKPDALIQWVKPETSSHRFLFCTLFWVTALRVHPVNSSLIPHFIKHPLTPITPPPPLPWDSTGEFIASFRQVSKRHCHRSSQPSPLKASYHYINDNPYSLIISIGYYITRGQQINSWFFSALDQPLLWMIPRPAPLLMFFAGGHLSRETKIIQTWYAPGLAPPCTWGDNSTGPKPLFCRLLDSPFFQTILFLFSIVKVVTNYCTSQHWRKAKNVPFN